MVPISSDMSPKCIFLCSTQSGVQLLPDSELLPIQSESLAAIATSSGLIQPFIMCLRGFAWVTEMASKIFAVMFTHLKVAGERYIHLFKWSPSKSFGGPQTCRKTLFSILPPL